MSARDGQWGPVPRRVAPLLAPPPLLLVATVAAIVLVSGLAALDAVRDLHAIVELAQAARSPDPMGVRERRQGQEMTAAGWGRPLGPGRSRNSRPASGWPARPAADSGALAVVT